MSKIEKALRKARESGASVSRSLVPTAPAAQTEVVRADARSAGRDVRTVESASTIAFMNQSTSLDPGARSARKIISPDASENATIRALRQIRTKLGQKIGNSSCVVMVTGTSLGGGASFVSANLGAAVALDSARTSLVIDCNVRDPYLSHLAVGEIKAGLTDYLTAACKDIGDIIMPTGIPRMRVVPAGANVDPTVEYFTMDRMHRLIGSVRDRYPDRQIILDCPPLVYSADAQILLELCDYVLIVVPYARSTPAKLQAALKLIDPRKLLGVVLNQEPDLPSIDWKSWSASTLIGMVRQVGATLEKLAERLNGTFRRAG